MLTLWKNDTSELCMTNHLKVHEHGLVCVQFVSMTFLVL